MCVQKVGSLFQQTETQNAMEATATSKLKFIRNIEIEMNFQIIDILVVFSCIGRCLRSVLCVGSRTLRTGKSRVYRYY